MPRSIPQACPGTAACPPIDQSGEVNAISIPMMVGGAAVLGLGIWMIVSAKTSVKLDGQDPADVGLLHLGPLQLSPRGLVF